MKPPIAYMLFVSYFTLISVISRSKSNDIFVLKLLIKLRNLWGQLSYNKVDAVYVKEGLF